MGSQLQNGKQQFVSILGTPLVGGKVYFYQPGTETPKTTYQDSALTIPNTNPVVLDARGQAVIWGSGTYRQVLVDAFGVQIWDQIIQDISAEIQTLSDELAASSGSSLIGFVQAATGSVARTAQDKLREWYSVEDAGCVGDGSDETAKLVAAITYAATNGIPLYWPTGKQYGFTNLPVTIGGGVFDWIGTPRLKQLAGRNAAAMCVQLGGVVVADGITLSATSLSQTSSVVLSDASSVQPGYLLRLMTNRLIYGDHRFDANNAFGQVAKVKSVSGNTVQLEDNIVFDLNVQAVTSGTAQGGTSGTITLSSADASTAHQLKNYLLTITAGTGAGQSRYINSYNPTTKVVDIGTTYTGFPQAPWATIPDATSQYSVTATVTARVINPAYIRSLGNAQIVGFAQASVDVYGVQIAFTDGAIIDGCDISGCSHWALSTYQNYRPRVLNNRFAGANYLDLEGSGNGQINGFGHYAMGDYDCLVRNNTAENCHDGFESINGTVYLTRIGNTVRGGGLSYDGVTPMYPGTPTDQTSGISCHTGSSYVTDIGNEVSDVYYNKQRGLFHVVQGNTVRGRSNSPFLISYSTGGIYTGNIYDDGMTNEPSTGMNANTNGNDGLPINSNILNRPAMFLVVRQSTMVEQSSIVARNNIAKSTTQGFLYLNAISSTSDIDLTVIDNDVSVVNETSEGVHIISSDSGTINFRMIRAWGNLLRVGGAIFGSLKADNMSLYPVLNQLPATASFVMQTGPTRFLCWLPAASLAQVAAPVVDQSTFKLNIFEKDNKVNAYFFGYVQRGNATPIVQFAANDLQIRTDTPAPGTGASDINVFLRTDSLWVNNKSATNCMMVMDIDGLLN